MVADSQRKNPMKELALPVRHEWLARERGYGKIAIEPFEPGVALRVRERIPEALVLFRGNSLRTSFGVASQFDKIAAPLHRSQRASMRLPTLPEKWFLTAFLDPPSIRST
jgi:hypothetical protein